MCIMHAYRKILIIRPGFKRLFGRAYFRGEGENWVHVLYITRRNFAFRGREALSILSEFYSKLIYEEAYIHPSRYSKAPYTYALF